MSNKIVDLKSLRSRYVFVGFRARSLPCWFLHGCHGPEQKAMNHEAWVMSGHALLALSVDNLNRARFGRNSLANSAI